MPNEVELLAKARDPAGTPFGLSYAHGAVHNDIIARATRVVSSGTGITNVLFKSPGPLQGHLEYIITAAADTEVRLYEAPTVTTEGTDMVFARLHLGSSKTTQSIAKTGGTVSAKGTLKDEQWNGGAGAGANVTGGSVVHDGAEWLLKVDTWYLIEIDRKTATKLGIALEWYEVPALA
jgi:hypothetical protein